MLTGRPWCSRPAVRCRELALVLGLSTIVFIAVEIEKYFKRRT
jgi:hypothetical protein